jgi:hypothetical protein
VLLRSTVVMKEWPPALSILPGITGLAHAGASAHLLSCLVGGARSGDEIEDRADHRSRLSIPQPPHACGKLVRLGAVLDQAGDDDAGVGEQRV